MPRIRNQDLWSQLRLDKNWLLIVSPFNIHRGQILVIQRRWACAGHWINHAFVQFHGNFPINESLIHSIEHNGHLIVVHTKPGTAMTVAKFIDDKKFDQVMGTVAGDDTIMIAPKNLNLTLILAGRPRQSLSKQYSSHGITCWIF